MYVYIYIYMQMCIYVYIYIYIYIYVYVCIYIYIYICIHNPSCLLFHSGGTAVCENKHSYGEKDMWEYKFSEWYDTGVCKINARSESARYGSRTPFPQRTILTK